MRALLLILAALLATPAAAGPERTPLTLLPVLAGEGVSPQEVEVLERDLLAAIERQRHFAISGPDALEPLDAHCRAQLGCIRASLPRARDQLTLDLRVERLGKVLALDLRLSTPAGPIERWRSTLTARTSPSVLREAVRALLIPHTPDALLFQQARGENDRLARDLLLRNYPDSAYARALLRASPAKGSHAPARDERAPASAGTPEAAEPILPVVRDEASPGSPEWIDYLGG